jgi:hypothetical protein
MRPVRTITIFAFASAVAVAGCEAQRGAAEPSAAPVPAVATPLATTTPTPTFTTPPTTSPAPAPRPTPTKSSGSKLYFATPQAAMRYLTGAYNRNDLGALGHVTTPVARVNLVAMRRTAVNLRLVGCEAQPGRGDYLCSFTHDYPAAMHLSGHGSAHFIAAPADRHGWYMTVLRDCS